MAVLTIEKQINNYLIQLNSKQKKAVLTVAKTFVEGQISERKSDIWTDKGFVADIERRAAELESGKVKGYTWDEVKQRAKQPAQGKKRK